MQEVKKIVVMGPESTGKSTLCRLLGEHYKTIWCPEYAREYLLAHGTNYTFDDLLTIAKKQILLEDEYLRKVGSSQSTVQSPSSIVDDQSTNDTSSTTYSHVEDKEQNLWSMDSRLHVAIPPLLFVDTDMYVMKVWCQYVFNRCHPFILEKVVERKCDLYLLCNIDLPWVKDELREYPDLKSRKELYEIYEDILINQTVPWVNVSGNYEERFATAVKAIDALLTA
jgi:nicotinamide riboside kinase